MCARSIYHFERHTVTRFWPTLPFSLWQPGTGREHGGLFNVSGSHLPEANGEEKNFGIHLVQHVDMRSSIKRTLFVTVVYY